MSASQAAAMDPSLRKRILTVYFGVLVGAWAWTEVMWWWRWTKWRARVSVPWQVRKTLWWPPR